MNPAYSFLKPINIPYKALANNADFWLQTDISGVTVCIYRGQDAVFGVEWTDFSPTQQLPLLFVLTVQKANHSMLETQRLHTLWTKNPDVMPSVFALIGSAFKNEGIEFIPTATHLPDTHHSNPFKTLHD